MKHLAILFLLGFLLLPTPAHATNGKGLVVNDEAPAHVNVFAPTWMAIELGEYNTRLNYTYGASKWALNLNEVEDWEIQEFLPLAMQHPSYDHWFILLNEPSEGMLVQQAADTANHQIELVLALDPLAKFCLSVGTGLHPPYRDNSYANQLWQWIENKPAIKALGVTYYPYSGSPQFHKFLTMFGEWKPNREHWVLEYGVLENAAPTVGITNGVPFTFEGAWAELAAYSDRAFLYAQRATPNTPAAIYKCLLSADGTMTELGEQF